MYSQSGIRDRFPQSSPQRARFIRINRHPFRVVLIPLVWEDTLWNSAIRGHHNMSTLIRIPAGHMRFVPAHTQSDEATSILSQAKWPVEFLLVANAKGRETFICHERIHQILGPAILATCLLAPAQTHVVPTPPSNRGRFEGCLIPPPRRSLSTCPTTLGRTSPYGPATSPRRISPGNNFAEDPTPRLNTHPNTPHL
jgi:hypothetical protein